MKIERLIAVDDSFLTLVLLRVQGVNFYRVFATYISVGTYIFLLLTCVFLYVRCSD